MEIHKKMSKDDITSLQPNSLVYVTKYGDEGSKYLVRTPVFITRIEKDGLYVFVNSGNDQMFVFLALDSYEGMWFVETKIGFTVGTPAGTIHVWDKKDSKYPGIYIDLYPANQADNNSPISLAMTEYIPGGEGLCGYDPERLWLSREEINEVPVERIVDKDGKRVAHKSGVTVSSGHVITAGLVTRTWPNEVNDQDYHKRTFHLVGVNMKKGDIK